MTQLQDLRKQAKERGLKGYYTLSKFDLLAGKPVTKKMKKKQVSVGTQTDFRLCNACGLEAIMMHLCFKADVGREISYDYGDDLETDAASGEVVGYGVD